MYSCIVEAGLSVKLFASKLLLHILKQYQSKEDVKARSAIQIEFASMNVVLEFRPTRDVLLSKRVDVLVRYDAIY